MSLEPKIKIDLKEIFKDLDKYTPRRKGWTWRKHVDNLKMHKFTFKDMSEPLKNSIPLPAAKYFENIDPQPDCVITTEIASGRFEDDIRRMRMAAWHGADHIMVIRTMGQSHMDGLLEGTPEGIGGVPITRKQLRATRKALDLIEDEVGRPINFHSYVSGVAGPEVAVLFAEEGVNGAHQDPQYNILYRNINMKRSIVDAAVAKRIMAYGEIFQIDGAHNANATAREAWAVMPELMVQHAINCSFSEKCGIKKENIGLSTVPPTAPPIPKMYYDLPYAVALREFFSDYKFRAQQNTRYMEADTDEATITHVIDTLISKMTSADIQSTITPDEGRNVPWHYNNIKGLNTAKQTFVALDGLMEMIELKKDGPLREKIRELKERAVLFMEEIAQIGYFEAVKKGMFVDSAEYPERHNDGIARDPEGGVGVNTICERDIDYIAPVSEQFGYNNPEWKTIYEKIGRDTFHNRSKIQFIDELDQVDTSENRMQKLLEDRKNNVSSPEVEWHGDGTVLVTLFFPEEQAVAEACAIQMALSMNLKDPEVVNSAVIHPCEGTYVEIKGKTDIKIDKSKLVLPEKDKTLSEDEIRAYVKENGLKVVAATVGEDEHSVGLREILDIKHGGIEKFGVKYLYLGTSCPIEKLVDSAIEFGAQAILMSTIISHNDIHYRMQKRLHEICVEKGVRDKFLLIGGGTQVKNDLSKESG
ncbi:MAG: D-ornithine 4,5-aminomutase subunit OraE, partial [Candidatus Muirbacterium halophilum]|nr:D-ornithine 4,5-aminomutase subunit OraE [Candidatus Muirbacterium halophilum]